jgi:hypothetical protein
VNLEIPPGSPFLEAAFYGLSAVVILVAGALVRIASRAAGDGAAAAASLQRRFFVATLAWVAVVSGASFAGLLLPRGGPSPVFVAMLAGVVVLGPLIARSRVGDRLARGLPLAWLVGFQGFRLPLELTMHRAATEGVMPEHMSYSGLNFDILTGISALLLAVALMATQVPRWVIAAWNWIGLALMWNIVGIAILSTPMIAWFGPDRLNVFVMQMPYTLLPAVLVLAAWACHLIVFRALSSRAASTPGPR